jgi:hypothetical protein
MGFYPVIGPILGAVSEHGDMSRARGRASVQEVVLVELDQLRPGEDRHDAAQG